MKISEHFGIICIFVYICLKHIISLWSYHDEQIQSKQVIVYIVVLVHTAQYTNIDRFAKTEVSKPGAQSVKQAYGLDAAQEADVRSINIWQMNNSWWFA